MYTYSGSSLKIDSFMNWLFIVVVSVIATLLITYVYAFSPTDFSALMAANLYLIIIAGSAVIFGRSGGMFFACVAALVLFFSLFAGNGAFFFSTQTHIASVWFLLKALFFLVSGWFISRSFERVEGNLRSATIAGERLDESINKIQDQNAKLQGRKNYLNLRYGQLERLTEFVQSLSTTMEFGEVYERIAATTSEIIGGGGSLLYMLEEERYVLHAFSPDEPAETEPDEFDLKAVETGRSLLVRDVAKEFRIDTKRIRRRCPMGSIIVAPIRSGGEVIGLLRMESRMPDNYSPDEQRLLSILSDISGVAISNARLYEQTQELAQRDGLTGLYQRWVFNEKLKEEIDRAKRYDYPFGLLMIDIDRFKAINDGYGHTVGDSILKEIAREISGIIREGDFPARFGGEEFVVILTRAEVQQLKDIAHRLRKRIEDALRVPSPDGEGRVTVSIGIAAYPDDGLQSKELVERADRALYSAKENGRNDVRLYSEISHDAK